MSNKSNTAKKTYGATDVSVQIQNSGGHTEEEGEIPPVDWKAAARGAYQTRDPESSKLLHDLKNQAHESHQTGGDYIKSAVYGGLDGIITTFATVTTVAGSGLSSAIILILGIAHLFADGLSMGLGDALSTQAENELYNHERAREVWELNNYPDGEVQEMIDFYEGKGVSPEDALLIVQTLSKYEEAFVDIMMVEELNLMPSDENPWMGGGVTFVSFMLFGAVPLLPYLVGLIPAFRYANDVLLGFSCALTIFTLFALGAAKGKFVGQSLFKSGVIMAFNGGGAAFIGYVIGALLKSAGIDDSS